MADSENTFPSRRRRKAASDKPVSGKPGASGAAKPTAKPAAKQPAKATPRNSAKPVAKPMAKPAGKGASKATGRPRRKSVNEAVPVPQRQQQTPKKSWGRRIAWGTLWATLLGIILLGVIFIASFYMINIPPVDEAVKAQRSVVYYADGQSEVGSLSRVDRKIIDTSTLPPYVGQAVVASEDRTFFENNGVDVKGIVRAFFNNLTGGQRQGASTLTQQYVENYYTGERSGYVGKYREAILAIKINQVQTKQEILNNYLNTIYFGRSAYGIEAAAHAYFEKDAKDLTLSEAAMLAGIIPAPSSWDPAKNPDKALARWQRVLRLMAEDGYITKEQAEEAQFPQVSERSTFVARAGNSGYLLDQVLAEAVEKTGIAESQLKNGGYRLVSTVDQQKQKQMEQVAADLPADASPNLRVAMVSVDNKSGAIVAEVGGRDYGQSQRNTVTQDTLHPGSTFKAFTLLAALEDGVSLYDRFNGNSPASFKSAPDWHPQNFGNISYGYVTLRKSVANSINTSFLHLNEQIGPEKTVQMATRLGVPKDAAGLDNGIGNVLGSASVHPLDMVNAYTVIANYGVKNDAYMLAEVRDVNDQIVYTAPAPKTQTVVDPELTKQALVAMQDVFEYGTAQGVSLPGWQPAGKSGSTNEFKSALFIGMVPQFTTFAGLYQVGEDGSEQSITPFGGYDEILGGNVPAHMWESYMKAALDSVEPAAWEKPNKKAREAATVSPEPVPSTEPAQPQQPAEPAQPKQPEEPKEPEQPSQPAEPAKPVKPSEPVAPTPGAPTKP